jgi:hypothetical protein
MTADSNTNTQPRGRVSSLLLRVVLATLTAILAVNLYTGAPLLAIWAGSRVQQGSSLTMSAVGVVIGVLVVSIAILVFLLTRVEAAYKAVTGQVPEKRTPPWLRSMRGESDAIRERKPLTGFEKVLTTSVVVAVAAFEAWFFFLSGSPIG